MRMGIGDWERHEKGQKHGDAAAHRGLPGRPGQSCAQSLKFDEDREKGESRRSKEIEEKSRNKKSKEGVRRKGRRSRNRELTLPVRFQEKVAYTKARGSTQFRGSIDFNVSDSEDGEDCNLVQTSKLGTWKKIQIEKALYLWVIRRITCLLNLLFGFGQDSYKRQNDLKHFCSAWTSCWSYITRHRFHQEMNSLMESVRCRLWFITVSMMCKLDSLRDPRQA